MEFCHCEYPKGRKYFRQPTFLVVQCVCVGGGNPKFTVFALRKQAHNYVTGFLAFFSSQPGSHSDSKGTFFYTAKCKNMHNN